MPAPGFCVWPITRRMVRLFTEAGFCICPECGRACADQRGLGAHRSKRHGIVGYSASVVAKRARAAATNIADLVEDASTS